MSEELDASSEQGEPWHPITDPIHLKYLGKIVEEGGGLLGIVGGVILQGFDNRDPKTGVHNVQALEDKIADVFASANLCIQKFNLDLERITQRVKGKMIFLKPLHEAAGQTKQS